MKTTPTGRVINGENYRRQQESALITMQRMMRELDNTSGVKKMAPDMYEVDLTYVDFALIEQRIMAAMKEDDGKA